MKTIGKTPKRDDAQQLLSLPSQFPAFASVQLEEQLSRLQREKNEIQNRLEEDQEDMNELMKKHKAAVAQVPRPGVPATPCTGTVPWSSL